MTAPSEASRRRALAEALALPPSPHSRERTKALAAALAPGAWTPLLSEAARAWMRALPEGPVGAACFPAVGPEGVVEVRVDVGPADAGGAAEVPPAVADAFAAARAVEGACVARLSARFTPSEGWVGRSCGLAVALAAISRLRSAPLRRSVWATGAVDATGRVERVDSLQAKRAASDGRTLLEPPSEEAEWPVATLEEAVAHAFGEAPPLPRARAIRASALSWVREVRRSWERNADADPLTAEDEALERGWREGASAFVVSGLPMSGRSWRLARFVERRLEEGTLVVVLRPTADAREGLAAALDDRLGALGAGDPRAADPAAQLARARALAEAVERQLLVVVDDPGERARGLLAEVCGSAGVRLAWTAPLGAAAPSALEVRCETRGVRTAAIRGALPVDAWTPENRVVFEHPLASRALPLLRDRDWRTPLTLDEVLRLLLAEVTHARAAVAGSAFWRRFGAHLLDAGDAPWTPPRALAQTAATLAERGLLRPAEGGFRPADRVLASALRAEACADVFAGWPSLPPPEAWEQAWRRGRASRGGPAHLWSPWEDALVRACLTLGPEDGRGVGRWSDALAARWGTGPARGAAGAPSDRTTQDPRLAHLALLTSLARADLQHDRAVLPRVARAVRRRAPGHAPLVVAGLALAVVYDTWPLALRRRARTLRLLDRVERALSTADLAPLRALVAGDAASIVGAILAGRVPTEPEVRWWPVMNVALLPDAWSPAAHEDVTAELRALQEPVCRAWHARMLTRCDDRALGAAERQEAREEAEQIAADRLRAAEADDDAEARGYWRPRARGTERAHGLGGDAERLIAREVYVASVLGSAVP